MKATVAASAAHVFCITTYATVVNHQTYISLNAVQNLSKLIQATAVVSHPPSDVEGHIEGTLTKSHAQMRWIFHK
jgi:hypothetical protein